jgi:hypothetical protein
MADIGLIAQWVATVSVAAGLVYSISHNHSSGDRQDTEEKTQMELDIKQIKKQLEDPSTGLESIKSEISAMRTNCAGVTGRFDMRIKHNEETVRELRNTPRG